TINKNLRCQKISCSKPWHPKSLFFNLYYFLRNLTKENTASTFNSSFRLRVHFHVTLLNLQGLTFSKRTLKNRRSSLPLSLFFSLPSFIKIRNPGYALPFYICLFTFALTLRNLEGLPIPKTNRSP